MRGSGDAMAVEELVICDDGARVFAAAANAGEAATLQAAWTQWQSDGRTFWRQMDALVEALDGLSS